MLCETDGIRRSFGRKPRNVCEKSFKKVENRPLLSNSVEAFLVPPHNLAERYPASSSGGVVETKAGANTNVAERYALNTCPQGFPVGGPRANRPTVGFADKYGRKSNNSIVIG